MTKALTCLSLLAIGAMTCGCQNGAGAATGDRKDSEPVLVGTVVRVTDGDTLQVLLDSGRIRVRLHGVDAPERDQPGGTAATEALATLIRDREVRLQPRGQDQYDRLLAVVHSNDTDINVELVKRGHAWAARRYMTRADAALCDFEAIARQRALGLWSGRAVAPWEWRQRNRRTPYTDYSRETSRDCVAAIGRSASPAQPSPARSPQ